MVLLTCFPEIWECGVQPRQALSGLGRFLPLSSFEKRIYCIIIPSSDIDPVNFPYFFGTYSPSLVSRHSGSQSHVR